MVRPILFSKLFKKLFKGKVYTFRALSEVCKSVVCLALCVNNLIAGLLHQVCLILPQVVCSLKGAIPSEDARSVRLDVIIEETFWRHSFVVALGNFVVMR